MAPDSLDPAARVAALDRRQPGPATAPVDLHAQQGVDRRDGVRAGALDRDTAGRFEAQVASDLKRGK